MRIGITRSSAAARMPASAVPLVSLRLLPLGSSPGVGSRSRSTASYPGSAWPFSAPESTPVSSTAIGGCPPRPAGSSCGFSVTGTGSDEAGYARRTVRTRRLLELSFGRSRVRTVAANPLNTL